METGQAVDRPRNFWARKDKVQDINICVLDWALDFNVTSAPPHTYNRSTFQGHVVDIKSQDDVIPALKAISMDTRVGQADHNIYAYRVDRGNSCVEHFNDDHEWGAGKRLLSILKEKGIKNKLLVVTRWFGGTYLESKRF